MRLYSWQTWCYEDSSLTFITFNHSTIHVTSCYFTIQRFYDFFEFLINKQTFISFLFSKLILLKIYHHYLSCLNHMFILKCVAAYVLNICLFHSFPKSFQCLHLQQITCYADISLLFDANMRSTEKYLNNDASINNSPLFFTSYGLFSNHWFI